MIKWNGNPDLGIRDNGAHITLTILRSQHGGTIGKANTEPIVQLLN